MTYSQEQREYWVKRPANAIKYMTVSFYHSDFGHINLVADQYVEKTLGGIVYTPVAMSVPEVTNQSSDTTYAGVVNFGRIGQQIRNKLLMITPVGAIREPITATLRQFEGDTLIYERQLYVATNGITISSDNVSIRLAVDNIARLTNKVQFYDPAVWQGLKFI